MPTEGLDGPSVGGRSQSLFLLAAKVIQPKELVFVSTKAQEVYEAVNALVDSGIAKSEAFAQAAKERGIKYDSARGSYYTHKRVLEGGGTPSSGTRSSGPRRSRKRETTPEDAIASAIDSLRGAVLAIGEEETMARLRSEEAIAEYADIQRTAQIRAEAINQKITALGGEPQPLHEPDTEQEPATPE